MCAILESLVILSRSAGFAVACRFRWRSGWGQFFRIRRIHWGVFQIDNLVGVIDRRAVQTDQRAGTGAGRQQGQVTVVGAGMLRRQWWNYGVVQTVLVEAFKRACGKVGFSRGFC